MREKKIGSVGDVNPIDYGGGFVLKGKTVHGLSGLTDSKHT